MLLLILPSVAGAPYLQDSIDSQHSGYTEDPGPVWLDLALKVELPGGAPNQDGMVLTGRSIFLAANDANSPTSSVDTRAGHVWKVDIDTGEVEEFARLSSPIIGPLASDGSVLFVVTSLGVSGFRFTDGSPAWPAIPISDSGPVPEEYCSAFIVHEDLLLLGCYGLQTEATVRAFDKQTGAPAWSIDRTTPPSLEIETRPEQYALSGGGVYTVDMVVVVDQLIVRVDRNPNSAYNWVNAYDVQTGEPNWAIDYFPPDLVSAEPGDQRVIQNHIRISGRFAAYQDLLLATQYSDIARLDAADGDVIWRVNPPEDQNTPAASARTVVSPVFAIVAFDNKLFRVNPSGTKVWPVDVADQPPVTSLGGVMLLGNSERIWSVGPAGLHVFDTATGQIIESRVLGPSVSSAAVAEGLVAMRQSLREIADPGLSTGFEPVSSVVTVYGVSALSPVAEVQASSRYPALGAPVTVDVGKSISAAANDPLEFLVQWGDGHEERGAGPTFDHTYAAAGDMTLQVQAIDSAGRERTTSLVMHPGQERPTFLSEAFSAENQESTFFTLGLILTLLFAGLGAVRIRRKRRVLRKELAAADEGVARLRGDPDGLREDLRTRRERAQRLFLQGRLDEGSTSLLRAHIDEILRDHRLSSVEEEMSFLPHGLFRSMQEMLRDAKVTALERTQFVRSLQAEASLTAAQRKRVQRHVENWHREDA